jgi:hypothetical protein
MEVQNQSSYYIEPGFSGAPVWDEELASFVGIVVSSELSKYSDNTVGKPAEELRKDLKVAYMIPAKVLVETWSFLSQTVQQQSIIKPTMQASRKKQRLQQELTDLLNQQKACEMQYRTTIDDYLKEPLKLRLDNYDQKIEDLEKQINDM